MSKERIIYKGEPCPARIKGNQCGHYSLLLTPRTNEVIPSAVRESKRGGKQCGLAMKYSNIERCVIPGNGIDETERKLYWEEDEISRD